jgi:hypothetical protein
LSTVDDLRKLLQDFLTPEVSAIKESLKNIDKVSDARFQAAQSQFATTQTHMELIVQMQTRTNDAVRAVDVKLDTVLTRLDALVRERAGAN